MGYGIQRSVSVARLLLCICQAALPAYASSSAWHFEENRKEIALKGGGSLELENPFGRIDVKKTSERIAGLTWTTQQPSGDPTKPVLVRDRTANNRLCFTWMDAPGLSPEATGDQPLRRLDAGLFAPEQRPLRLVTLDGDIRAKGLLADVEASTVSGSITVSTRGCARITSQSGSIWLVMKGTGTSSRPQHLQTDSGRITLRLPREPCFRVAIRTDGRLYNGLEDNRAWKTFYNGAEIIIQPRLGFFASIVRFFRPLPVIEIASRTGDVHLLEPVPDWKEP